MIQNGFTVKIYVLKIARKLLIKNLKVLQTQKYK